MYLQKCQGGTMKKTLCLSICFLLAAVSLTFSMGGGGGGASQKTHRGFEGRITDQDGNPLKGVDITLFSADPSELDKAKATEASKGKKNLSTMTGKGGKYRFVAVRHGYYRVRFSI